MKASMSEEAIPRELAPSNNGSQWLGGLLLVAGIYFFWVSLGWLSNWWAIFILFPALTFLGVARLTAKDGRYPFITRLTQGLGFIILTVALMFLFNMDWSAWWPLMVIMPGVGIFLIGNVWSGDKTTPAQQAVANTIRWLGRSVVLLGSTFLLHAWGWADLDSIGFGWWGFFILIPAIAALKEARQLHQEDKESPITAVSLGLVGLWLGSSAFIELFSPGWHNLDTLLGLACVIAGSHLLIKGIQQKNVHPTIKIIED